ncbi:class I SAM-dependent methyltransferase [Kitasatospora sp. NPDC001664]
MTGTRPPQQGEPAEAARWSAHYAQGRDFVPVADEEVKLLLAHTGAGRRVLDIGCGTGALAAALADAGFTVTAVDFSAAALAAAEDRHGHHPNLTFRLTDIEHGGLDALPAGGFDLITCRLFLPFIDLFPFTACARHLLADGGTLHITTPVDDQQAPDRRSIALRTADLDLLRSFPWQSTAEYPLGDLLCLALTR